MPDYKNRLPYELTNNFTNPAKRKELAALTWLTIAEFNSSLQSQEIARLTSCLASSSLSSSHSSSLSSMESSSVSSLEYSSSKNSSSSSNSDNSSLSTLFDKTFPREYKTTNYFADTKSKLEQEYPEFKDWLEDNNKREGAFREIQKMASIETARIHQKTLDRFDLKNLEEIKIPFYIEMDEFGQVLWQKIPPRLLPQSRRWLAFGTLLFVISDKVFTTIYSEMAQDIVASIVAEYSDMVKTPISFLKRFHFEASQEVIKLSKEVNQMELVLTIAFKKQKVDYKKNSTTIENALKNTDKDLKEKQAAVQIVQKLISQHIFTELPMYDETYV